MIMERLNKIEVKITEMIDQIKVLKEENEKLTGEKNLLSNEKDEDSKIIESLKEKIGDIYEKLENIG